VSVSSVKQSANGVRKFCEWDLRDASGRPVFSGNYAVRGSVVGKGGKRESVSLVVGVRQGFVNKF